MRSAMRRTDSGIVGVNSDPAVSKDRACPQLTAACGTQFAGHRPIRNIVEFFTPGNLA
jgi:hypothetical protein